MKVKKIIYLSLGFGILIGALFTVITTLLYIIVYGSVLVSEPNSLILYIELIWSIMGFFFLLYLIDQEVKRI